MHEVKAKSILSARNEVNLCRGCGHGCTYCDSRSTCYGMNHTFEDIEVRINSPELLEQTLRRRRKRCMIGTGAMCDPYMPAERGLGLTKKCLEITEHYEFGVSISTKSDLILRDLDLLKRINQKTRCMAQMTLTACVEDQRRIIGPHVCTTSRGAQVLEIMQDKGVPVIIWMCPILPFINDTEGNIQSTIEYGERARVHGILAFDIGVALRDGDTQYFYSRLDEHHPGLKKQCMDMYGNAHEVGSPCKRELIAFFKHLCRERQMEADINKLFAYLQKFKDREVGKQLSFMDLIQSLPVILGVPVKPGLSVSFSNTGSFLLCKPPFHPYP